MYVHTHTYTHTHTHIVVYYIIYDDNVSLLRILIHTPSTDRSAIGEFSWYSSKQKLHQPFRCSSRGAYQRVLLLPSSSSRERLYVRVCMYLDSVIISIYISSFSLGLPLHHLSICLYLIYERAEQPGSEESTRAVDGADASDDVSCLCYAYFFGHDQRRLEDTKFLSTSQ